MRMSNGKGFPSSDDTLKPFHRVNEDVPQLLIKFFDQKTRLPIYLSALAVNSASKKGCETDNDSVTLYWREPTVMMPMEKRVLVISLSP